MTPEHCSGPVPARHECGSAPRRSPNAAHTLDATQRWSAASSVLWLLEPSDALSKRLAGGCRHVGVGIDVERDVRFASGRGLHAASGQRNPSLTLRMPAPYAFQRASGALFHETTSHRIGGVPDKLNSTSRAMFVVKCSPDDAGQ
jgi:hypothetical protein